MRRLRALLGFAANPRSTESSLEEIRLQVDFMIGRLDNMIQSVENVHAAVNRISYDIPTHFAENIAMQSGVIEKIVELMKRMEADANGNKSKGALLRAPSSRRKKAEKSADIS